MLLNLNKQRIAHFTQYVECRVAAESGFVPHNIE